MERDFNSFIKKRQSKFWSLVELVRVWNALLIATMVFLGYYLVAPLSFPFSLLLLVFAFAIMYFAAAAINDICDVEPDRVNAPYRPLHSGVLSLKEAKFVAILSYVVALSLGFLVGTKILLVLLLTAFLSFIYSARPFSLKNKVLFATAGLSILTVFLPLYAGSVLFLDSFWIGEGLFKTYAVFTGFFFFIALLKDLKDLAGDIVYHKRTLAIKLGSNNTITLSITGIALLFPATVYYFSKLFSNKPVFYLISASILFGLIWILAKSYDKSQYHAEELFKNARILTLAFSLILLLFVLFKG